MKAIVPSAFLFYIILLFSGCETTEKIDEFPLRPSRLVVNSYFAPDSAWAFQVSKSLSVLDNAELEYVNDASVKIFRNSVLIDSITESGSDGWYQLNRNLPKQGEKYSIEVSTPQFKKSLYAEDMAPGIVPISGVSFTIIDSAFYRDHYYYFEPEQSEYYPVYGRVEGSFNITINDPGDAENYYQLSLFKDYVYYNYEDSMFISGGRQQIMFTTKDAVADGGDTYRTSLLFNDEIFNGQQYQIKLDFEEWDVMFDSNFTVELIVMNRAGYLYRRSVEEYMASKGDPFSEPVLIYGNIENGYGIFAGYAVDTFALRLFD